MNNFHSIIFTIALAGIVVGTIGGLMFNSTVMMFGWFACIVCAGIGCVVD